jgi:DNA-binding response OmpR family regulator
MRERADRVQELERELEKAQDKILNLTEQIEILKSQLVDTDNGFYGLALRHGLTHAHTTILRLLFKRPGVVATKEQLLVGLYAHRPDHVWGDGKTLEVHVCRIRKKMPPDSIETFWGRGYRLTEVGRAWIKAELESVLR